MIGDIVSVRAAGAGLEKRRRIGITDAELVEVTDQLARVREGEPAIKLKSIRTARNAGVRCILLSHAKQLRELQLICRAPGMTNDETNPNDRIPRFIAGVVVT